MSYDYNTLAFSCNHRQVNEHMSVSLDDFRTLVTAANPSMRMRAPLNGRTLVHLRLDGVEVPNNHPTLAWDILDDELTTLPDKRQKLVFRAPLRRQFSLLELEYTTTAPYCLRCGGKGLVNDLQQAGSGGILTIDTRMKLIQRCLKFMLTSKCAFYPNLVCQIREFVGAKFGLSLTEDDITLEVGNSLANLQSVQQYQAKVQTLTPEEMLRSLDGVSAVRSTTDPCAAFVTVNVSGFNGTTATIPFSMRVSA